MNEILNLGSMLIGLVCVVLIVAGLAGSYKPCGCDAVDCDTCPFPCERHDKEDQK